MMEGRKDSRKEGMKAGRKEREGKEEEKWMSIKLCVRFSAHIRSARNITFTFVFSQPNVDFGPQFTGLKANLTSCCWNIPHPLLQSCANHWDSLRPSSTKTSGRPSDLQLPIHPGALPDTHSHPRPHGLFRIGGSVAFLWALKLVTLKQGCKA